MTDKPVERHYLIFIKDNAPQTLSSTVNLISSYKKQIAEMMKKGEWARPITFVDEDGDEVAVYPSWAIMGIVRGYVVPDQKPEMSS